MLVWLCWSLVVSQAWLRQRGWVPAHWCWAATYLLKHGYGVSPDTWRLVRVW